MKVQVYTNAVLQSVSVSGINKFKMDKSLDIVMLSIRRSLLGVQIWKSVFKLWTVIFFCS